MAASQAVSASVRARPVRPLVMVRELKSGGVERDTSKLVRALDRAQFDPHVVALFASGFRHDELVAASVPVTEVPLRSYLSTGFFHNAAKLKRLIADFRPDLIHSYDVSGVLGSIVGRWARVPVIITAQLSYRNLADPKTRWLLRLSDRLADAVIVNCDAVRKHMIDDEHVPAGKVVRIYNGVDTDEFYPANDPRPAAVADASLVIGCVCVFRKEKDLPTLMRAFAKVRYQQPGLKLLLVGGGEQMETLRALAAKLDLRDQLVLLPGTPRPATWLRSMDIFVLPSTSEAFSNSLLEAMACGRACIASNVGGSPELIALNGECGLLFQAGNVDELAARLCTLIASPETRSKLGQRAAHFARSELSMERNLSETTALWTRLLQRKRDAFVSRDRQGAHDQAVQTEHR